MSAPTSEMSLRPSNVAGVSVTIAMPTISTAESRRPCSSTKRSLTTRAAAAPSDVGEHCSLVSGSWIMRDASTSSREYSSRNCARGLSTECRWFFTATCANISGVEP